MSCRKGKGSLDSFLLGIEYKLIVFEEGGEILFIILMNWKNYIV